jgi:CRISPR-associated exonuclease Cas4
MVIDSKIAIDFIKTKNGIILHEVKKSAKLEEAHKIQLLYYIYYLKKYKGMDNVRGVIHYPLKRRVVEMELDKNSEEALEKSLAEVKRIVSLEEPPKPEKKKYCKKCSYFELCWC